MKTATSFKEALFKGCPWGLTFFKRSNFEWGYFVKEGYLVKKYLRTPSRIMVIGSGNGREARPISTDGHKIVCMDIGPIYLKSAQKLFAKEGKNNVCFVQANMLNLPFNKESFNFIFFSLYSYAGESRFNILRDIHRILSPGGLVLLTACTPLYNKIHPRAPSAAWMSSIEQIRKETSLCGFILLEGSVDSERPEYSFSILKKII